MIGSKEQEETTRGLFDSRWIKWPRHQLRYDGGVGFHSMLEDGTHAARQPNALRSALLRSLDLLIPSRVRHGKAKSKQSPLVGHGTWCSVCGAHTKARKHNLRYQCGGRLQGSRWKLKQLAAGQDPNGLQQVGTCGARRLRTTEVEEWGLQLG